MTFCHECGKPVVPPSSKFCRNCGASQLEEAQLATKSAVSVSPVSSQEPLPAPEIPPQSPQSPPESHQVPVESVGQTPCSSCGSPLSPGEKYCGICGSLAGENPPWIPPAPGIPVPARVSICASCGSSVAETGRFCGVCGASINSNAPPPPVSTSLKFNAPPAQQSSQSHGSRLCRSCGTLIRAGDKFCSNCLAKVVDDPVGASEPYQVPAPLISSPPLMPPPPPPFAQTPSQHPAQPSGIRLCRSCGNPINTGDKFCSKCLAKVVDDIPVMQVQNQLPPVQVQPPTPLASLLVCASCGSPVTPTEKFCGMCGTSVQSATLPSSAPPQPVAKTCTKCGAPVGEKTRFCGSCGAAVGARIKIF
jgi:predicted amidophosphoribosyltransferase